MTDKPQSESPVQPEALDQPQSADALDLQTQIDEITADLQRTRADFENYRKRVETEKQSAREAGRSAAIGKLLPVIDTIDRAVTHTPEALAGDPWVQGVAKLPKSLEKALEALGVAKIDSKQGVVFDPELHEAIQFEEDAEGDTEVIAEELQAGYTIDGTPVRHAMVKVTRR